MKIDYISDIHIDKQKDFVSMNYLIVKKLNIKGGDIIVVAGDISRKNTDIEEFFLELKKFYKHIIFVSGNHEYNFLGKEDKECFNNCIFQKLSHLKKFCLANDIYYLKNEGIQIEGICFYGGFVNYDYSFSRKKFSSSNKDIMNYFYEQNDYLGKKEFWNNINYFDFTNKVNDEFTKKVLSFNKSNQIDIMITHVPPLTISRFKEMKYYINTHNAKAGNIFFNDNLIQNQVKPSYWLSGHSHISLNKKFNNTHYLINSHILSQSKKRNKIKSIILSI